MGFFGPSYKEIWGQAAEALGAEYNKGGFFSSAVVSHQHKNRTITLDKYTVSTGKTYVEYTRVRCDLYGKRDFKSKIYRKGFFSGLGKALGLQDIEIGFPQFDEDFIIKSNDEDLVRNVLGVQEIRSLMSSLKYINIKTRSKHDGSGNMEYLVPRVIKDVEAVKNIFHLFTALLDRYDELGIV